MRLHLTLKLRLKRAIVTRRFLIENDQVGTKSTKKIPLRRFSFREFRAVSDSRFVRFVVRLLDRAT
jgi:hypothetical protein